MLRSTDVAAWKVTGAVIVAIVSGLVLIAATWLSGGRDRLARWAGVVIVALVSFAIYKEGVVRIDAGHLTVLFANAAVLWLAVGLGSPHRRWILAGAAIVFAISLPVRPPGSTRSSTCRQPALRLRPGPHPGQPRAARRSDRGRADPMRDVYGVAPGALAALRGHSVAVEPWEIAAAWAYELDWRPCRSSRTTPPTPRGSTG